MIYIIHNLKVIIRGKLLLSVQCTFHNTTESVNGSFLKDVKRLAGKNFIFVSSLTDFLFCQYRIAGYFCKCLISVYFCGIIKYADIKIAEYLN